MVFNFFKKMEKEKKEKFYLIKLNKLAKGQIFIIDKKNPIEFEVINQMNNKTTHCKKINEKIGFYLSSKSEVYVNGTD